MKTQCRIRIIALFFSLLFCIVGRVFGQHRTFDAAVNDEARNFMFDRGHIGLSIGILSGDKTYTYNYGTIKKGSNIKPTAATVYEIASITKSFTGILLAHAVLEKKINLNDDVSKYLDGSYPGLTYKGHAIKIINLANHTSGLPKNVPAIKGGLTFEQIVAEYKNYPQALFLKELGKIHITTMPGEKFNYSNAGAQLIGLILEKVYRLSYDKLIEKYITGQARMTQTEAGVKAIYPGGFATGYDDKGNATPQLLQWANLPAAGGLKSNILDMLGYIRLNLNEKDPAIKLAHQVTFKNTSEDGDDIGLFWFSKNLPGVPKKVEHAGGSFGTTTYCLLYPQHNMGIVLLCNDARKHTEHYLKRMALEIFAEAAGI